MFEPVWRITENSQTLSPGVPTLIPYQEKWVVFLLCVCVRQAVLLLA